jgi:hypothetical protein
MWSEAPRGGLSCRYLPQDPPTGPIDDEIGVGQSIEGIEIEDAELGAIEGLAGLTRDLHVLMPHRLLL